MQIICPYCFKKFNDDEVHFRSEYITPENVRILPTDYDSYENFMDTYTGRDKQTIAERYQEAEFFRARDPFADPEEKYTKFWNHFGGVTTEDSDITNEGNDNQNSASQTLKNYYRPIIDPANSEHQKYLEEQEDGGYLIRNRQGMVTQIELKYGGRCSRRVCPECHNPIPDIYGQNQVKFLTVVGVTGSGKTVYMSSLLRGMQEYAASVGLSAIVTSSSVQNFLVHNQVRVNRKLPSPTPKNQFQQPLFFEIKRTNKDRMYSTETLVLYDVAGELFKSGSAAQIASFAPFVNNADGILLLIKPAQLGGTEEDAGPAVEALNAIYSIVVGNAEGQLCKKPMAVCISQVDKQSVQDMLQDDTKDLLKTSLEPLVDENENYLSIFNWEGHRPIAKSMRTLLNDSCQKAVNATLMSYYTTYDYFAFTALGCDVEDNEPVGPIIPKRIEEPLYWLFHKLGFIGTNEVIMPDCPQCGRNDKVKPLPAEEREERGGLFGWKRVHYSHRCNTCGIKF